MKTLTDDSIVRTFYGNGQRCEEYNLVNGKKEGIYRSWYVNGEFV